MKVMLMFDSVYANDNVVKSLAE